MNLQIKTLSPMYPLTPSLSHLDFYTQPKFHGPLILDLFPISLKEKYQNKLENLLNE